MTNHLQSPQTPSTCLHHGLVTSPTQTQKITTAHPKLPTLETFAYFPSASNNTISPLPQPQPLATIINNTTIKQRALLPPCYISATSSTATQHLPLPLAQSQSLPELTPLPQVQKQLNQHHTDTTTTSNIGTISATAQFKPP